MSPCVTSKPQYRLPLRVRHSLTWIIVLHENWVVRPQWQIVELSGAFETLVTVRSQLPAVHVALNCLFVSCPFDVIVAWNCISISVFVGAVGDVLITPASPLYSTLFTQCRAVITPLTPNRTAVKPAVHSASPFGRLRLRPP